MKSITLFIFAFGFVHFGNLNAQTKIEADPRKWTAQNCEAIFIKDTIHLVNTARKKSAVLWLNNTHLKNGIVELDIKGKDVRGESFLGIAFHGLDNDHYDAIYFRPFNFKSPERKKHSVQYIDKPDNEWEVLREKYPGKYENEVVPVPDPNDWFHAKIVINYPDIKVYVNGSAKPSLEVKQISKRKDGKLGLWMDSEDGWFRNVSIAQTN